MTTENPYHNNPLHGLKLETLLNEIVDQYGFDLLDAYLNINCFRKNPSIASSIKFLKKTDWAREKVEAFYLYQYKGLPKADDEQFQLPPRARIVPADQKTKEPADLSFEDAERLRAKKAIKTRERAASKGNPWANVK
ncbi:MULTISPECIES: VF530 family DNA-binding protein [Colwelliaceae]|uniref:VF530 family protein n=1 Tax=Colwelliaceae TaxID=267889 RepID=UPI000971262F|nr:MULTISPECIES: VF530 family DNA-binding protein [Colwelliaceae]